MQQEQMMDDSSPFESEKNQDKKEKKNKKKPVKKSVAKSGGKVSGKVQLDFSHDLKTLEKLQEMVKEANVKKIGRKVTIEDIIAQLLENADNDFILEVQKKSLTADEEKAIFSNYFSGKATLIQ